jgi:RNA polymerase sigma-70 factor (ECF subfamily)
LFDRQLREAVDRAIGGLSPTYREILVLRDVEGLPAAEVARITGLSIEAIKSRLHRARATVRGALAPLLGVSPRSRRARGCPDIIRLFSRHLEGEIGADTCAEMERHLAGCPDCRTACESLKQTLRLCRESPAPRVPGALQDSIRMGIRRLLVKKA